LAQGGVPSLVRLNKYLSICGVTSRRGADQLISQKRVTINNITADKPGIVIDETKDAIRVDGTEVTPVKANYYVLLNKPKMVITSLHDPFQRRTVAYFTSKVPSRVYPVGRLDYDTEGVLILTNDGDLAYRLAHPKYQIKKVYHAYVTGIFTLDEAKLIEKGIKLEDGHIGHGQVKILFNSMRSSKVQIILTEGHKREVKQLLKAVGHQVKDLYRVEFAGLKVEGLKLGKWRFLDYAEVRKLKDMVGL
jgi:23S rRNA pseudouridine2605 synthase